MPAGQTEAQCGTPHVTAYLEPLYDSGWVLSADSDYHTWNHNVGRFPYIATVLVADDHLGTDPVFQGLLGFGWLEEVTSGRDYYGLICTRATSSQFQVFQGENGIAYNGSKWYQRGVDYIRLVIWGQVNFDLPDHASYTHADGCRDELDVTNLSGLLADPQDAAWLQGLAITTTAPIDGQVLAWNAAAGEWQPTFVTGTGSYTMPDIITATISGTVPVIITDTYHFTETLSSGHNIAIIRSFTYGEASIAIALFALLALLAAKWVFELTGR